MRDWQRIARRIRVPLGFLFAGVYLWLARPTSASLVVGSCIAVVGLMVRALASGHVRKNAELTASGPYAYTRNPLYLGSMVLAAGFAIASRSWLIVALLLVMLVAIYLPVIRSEEEFLRARFPEFADYSARVPRLFPRFTKYKSSPISFSWHLYFKHREYDAAIGTVLMITALLLKPFLQKAGWLGR
jgi:protein-S-isoprenylcysteine O-methyltransferase Ste14